jgi:hypothetical protein
MSTDHHGCVLNKKNIDKTLLKDIKKELTVAPEVTFGNFKANSYKIFKENEESITVPYFYIKDKIKDIKINFQDNKINLPENSIKLRPGNQVQCYEKCIDQKKLDIGGGIINIQTGGGKCLGYNTPVLLFSGQQKMVQDIIVGDLLLGPDGSPRKVLSTTRGKQQMYKISMDSEYFTCNASHILSLTNKITKTPIDCNSFVIDYFCEKNLSQRYKYCNSLRKFACISNHIKKNYNIVNITVDEYLASECDLKMYQGAPNKTWDTLVHNPYIIGLKMGKEVITKIHRRYLTCTYDQRLQILAGIIDGNRNKKIYDDKYVISMNFTSLTKDIIFLIRSLGLKAYHKKSKYNSIIIYGYLTDAPVVIPTQTKKTTTLLKKKNSVKIKITPCVSENEYYGFEIDGDRLFLLGNYYVTHNTVLGIKLISDFSLKSLIIVNKIELLNQWKAELEKFIPGIRIGKIQGKTFDDPDTFDVAIGMIQSISMKNDINSGSFLWAGMCIIDECHNIASEVFSKIMFKIRPKYLFGLSATLERKDKLEKIIKWYIGDVIFSDQENSSNKKQETEIQVYKYHGKSSIDLTLKDGTAAVSSMITNISEDKERTNIIIRILKELSTNEKRNILVLSDRTKQLKEINKLIPQLSGLFIGSMKQQQLIESKTKRILLATYGMANEGFNHQKLNCLVFATPRSSVTQAIGRIFRKKHNDVTPIIVDIVDTFSIFNGQHYRRKKIYKNNILCCSYKIISDLKNTESSEIFDHCLITE